MNQKNQNKEQISLTILSAIARPHCDAISNVIFEIIYKDLGTLNESYGSYSQLFRVLSLFAVRVSHITNGILELISENNVYCSNVLLRSLMEHAYKIDYITNRAIHEKNDLVAKEYLQFCDLAEELQYQNALDYVSQTLDNKIIDDEAYNDLLIRKPDLNKFSKKEIFEKTKQFSFSCIHKYLINNKNIDKNILLDSDLRKGIEATLYNAALYSDLSSYIHGGPFAEKSEISMSLDHEENEEALFKIIEYLMCFHFYSNITIVGFLNELDEKYKESIEKVAFSLLDYYKKI